MDGRGRAVGGTADGGKFGGSEGSARLERSGCGANSGRLTVGGAVSGNFRGSGRQERAGESVAPWSGASGHGRFERRLGWALGWRRVKKRILPAANNLRTGAMGFGISGAAGTLAF